MEIFSKRLKAERDALKHKDPKWTQEYVADLLGVARTTYTAYENGTKLPQMDTLNKIADIFGVDTDFLLGRTSAPHANKNSDISDFEEILGHPVHGAFFKGYLDAPEQKKEQMRQFLKFILEQERDRKPGDKQDQ